MDRGEADVSQPAAVFGAVAEPTASKVEISDQNIQSDSASVNMLNVAPPTSHDPLGPIAEPADGKPIQNGFGTSLDANGSLSAQDAPQIPAPSEVPAISAIIDDPQIVPGESLPAHSLPVSQILNDPAVQPETSTLRSTPQPQPQPIAEPVKQEERLEAALPSPPSPPAATDITAAAEVPPPQPYEVSDVTVSQPPEAVAQATESDLGGSRSTGELPHRSPGAPSIVPADPEPLREPQQAPTESIVSEVHNLAPVPAPEGEDQLMTDVPASPNKLARSRDEEDDDEPATKRLKADENADNLGDLKMTEAPALSATLSEPPAAGEQSIAVEATPSAGDNQQASTPQAQVPRSFNSDFDKPITAPQKKALQKILPNIKRGPHAIAFKEPVDPVALNIPTYFDVVKNPMDLSTMERKIKNSEYSTVNEFFADFDQIVTNSELFNGLAHGVTMKAHEMRRSFDKQINQVPPSEFVEPPPPEKKGARRVSTEAPKAQRRESRSSVGNAKSPTAGSPASPAFALQPSGIPVIRRDSNAGDGRPRREIHPPAPKDLPYSAQKPKKKKFQWELKFCQEIINEFKKPKYQASSWPFLQPVDPVAMNIPTYHKVIKKPMDLGTMEQKLKTGQYENAKEFETDIRQIFWNCFKFNVSGDTVFKAGESLEKLFDDKWESKKQWIKDHAPSSSVVSPESSAEGSDDDDEDDDDDEEEEEEARKRNQTKISEIESQISTLSKELQELRKVNEAPPKKKQRPKNSGSKSKDSKKKGKADKKSSGGSKSKKAKELPYVTYEQKQAISERINSLPPDRMNAALNIIRSNMPGLKGEDEEIELDIDELSNEVLHKLLNFVKKYAPRSEDQVEIKRDKPAASTKPKKNKPMGKVEQEARIKELREKLQGAVSDDSGGAGAADDSSGDDDSEESEED